MKDLAELQRLLSLKDLERAFKTLRRESVAEHTWGCLVVAEYFLPKISLDKYKVMQLLLYHDVVEIEAGDVFFLDDEKRKTKAKDEQKAFRRLLPQLPAELRTHYTAMFDEFEARKTREAQFAHAIDKLEPMIYFLKDKAIWKRQGITAASLLEKKRPYMEPFPEILRFFDELMQYLQTHGYV